MITMDDALYELFRSHQITAEDAMTFAQDKGSLAKRMPVQTTAMAGGASWPEDGFGMGTFE